MRGASIPVENGEGRLMISVRRTLLLLASLLLLAAAGAAEADTTLHTVLQRGKLIAGITFDAPPDGYVDGQGHILGYCADVARYMAKRLGVGVEFVQVTAASRVPLLQTSRIDAEFGITTPQKIRNEVVDFTYSYIWDNTVLLVREGSSTNPADYIGSEKIMGSTQGNGDVDNWKKKSPNANFKLFREETDVVLALKKGDVDADVSSEFNAVRFAKSGGLTVTPIWKTSPDAIMVRQDDSKWRNWLNWALQRMWAEGTLQKLYVKWYGIEPSFQLGDNREIQQRVLEIGETDDPWKPLPDQFLETLLGDKSYTLQ
jgi:polar amino acid transport system substrate-binding protein